MDETRNDLALDELEPQAAPEVPEVPESYTAPVEEADCAPEIYTAPVEEADCIPEAYTAPVMEAESYTAPVEEVPAKPKKKLNLKLNKKVLLGGIAAAVVIALVIVLVSLLGGGTKSYGVYVKDGEINLFVKGMKEPVELSSRLWKDGDNYDIRNNQYALGSMVAIRDNGNLVIYPDKFTPRDGATLYMCNPNKPKEDPVKIDSGVANILVNDEGTTLVYKTVDKNTLYVYDLKNQEELMKEKNVIGYTCSEDLSKICFLTDDGKVYIWTAKTDSVKVAKDASSTRYFPETNMLFVLTEDGELLRKTAEMEEAEEIAEDVSRITAAYASGEVYYVRDSKVERNLLDYFDDDMAADDANLTKPKKPTYPTAPKKPYSWNYYVYADYEKAMAEYTVKYAEYQAEYNRLKTAYNEALAIYNAKAARDEIRERLDRTVTSTEYALSYFNGTEEVLISDSATNASVNSRAYDVPVVVYSAYVAHEVEKPKMSEAEDMWATSAAVSRNLYDALYGETQLFVVLGAESFAVEHEDATNVMVSGDGTTVFFLDAPFEAFSDGKYTSSSSAPAADVAVEAPAATIPADGDEEEETEEEKLIPRDMREYASLYKITIADGAVGAPELFDSEVSVVFAPYVGDTAEDIYYYKAVDGDDKTGEFWRNGQFLADDIRASSFTVDGDLLLFYTDWDTKDRCGTLCALNLADKKAEVVEVGDDVISFQVNDAGDILFLQDYDWDDCEGTLMQFTMGKDEAVELADEVICLLTTR